MASDLSDGERVGTVDRLERGFIKLARQDDPGGAGEHRAVPLGLIASTEGDVVRLTVSTQQARAVAAGGLDPRDVVEDGTAPERGDEDAAELAASAGAGVPDDGGARGVPPGEIGSTGAAARGAHGDGTGGGGTSRRGYLGGGPGIADDPNMDPDGGQCP